MNRWKSQGLLLSWLGITIWIGLLQGSGSALDVGTSSDASADGPSTIEIVTRDASDSQASEESAAPAESPQSEASLAEDPPSEPGEEASGEPAPAIPAEGSEQAVQAPQQFEQTGEEPLAPIPDPQSSGRVTAETVSFNGITPEVSTLSDVQEAWGAPKEIAHRNAQLVHLYAIEPFEQVEVSFVKDRVGAIVIRLDRAFPAGVVAEKLELAEIRPGTSSVRRFPSAA